MPMDSNALIQAMQSKQSGVDLNDPQALLSFILSRFDLVPKEQEQDEPMDVQTQESHAP